MSLRTKGRTVLLKSAKIGAKSSLKNYEFEEKYLGCVDGLLLSSRVNLAVSTEKNPSEYLIVQRLS